MTDEPKPDDKAKAKPIVHELKAKDFVLQVPESRQTQTQNSQTQDSKQR